MSAKLNFLSLAIDGPIDWGTVGTVMQQAFGIAAPAATAQPGPAALPAPESAPTAPAEPARRKPGRKPRAAISPPAEMNGAPAVGKRQAGRLARLDKIEQFISRVGSATSSEIRDACGIPAGSITSLLKDPRFIKTDDGSYRVD